MNNNYSRRKFLKTVVISAGAAGATGLAGCGGESRRLSSGVDSVDLDGSRFPQSVASGDPRDRSIILWTRVSAGLGEQTLTVEVSTDESFRNIVVSSNVTASYSSDHCVKVKVMDLSRYTRYYYRFIHEGVSTRTGTFRTAPGSNSDTNVKFGFVSCQDYTNGYYNTLLKFLEEENEDLDFIVHLGDYIYETTGDATFQGSVPGRTVNFSNETDAIDITPSNLADSSLAASTVSQYRDIYKTYRTDETLQRVHEKFPFICIWDDHEFSDDAWQDRGTYFDGKQDEQDETRKTNAEQAFFEYQPIDLDPKEGSLLPEGQQNVNRDDLYPSILYRSFRYGRRLNLILSDYRTYRPDHLIPEDAFPAQVVMTNTQLGTTLLALLQAGTIVACSNDNTDLNLALPNDQLVAVLLDNVNFPTPEAKVAALGGALGLPRYVDIDDPAYAFQKGALTAILTVAYQGEGLDAGAAAAQAASVVTGNLDTTTVNALLTQGGQGALVIPDGALPYGISYSFLGKQDLYSSNGIGSRYLVVKNTFDLYTAYKSLVEGDSAYDDAWGLAQTTAVFGNLLTSTSTWNVVGSSTSFTSMVLDNSIDGCSGTPSSLRSFLAAAITQASGGAIVPDPNDPDDPNFPLPAAQFYLNVDQWDGFPIRRRVFLDNPTGALPTTLKETNAVLLAGDIHARFVTDHGTDENNNRCVEFTTPAVSSGTLGSFVTGAVASVLADAASDTVNATYVGQAAQISGGVTGLWGGLAQAFSDANESIVDAEESTNGVSIIELKTVNGEEVMDVTFHEIETSVIQGALTALVPSADYTTNLVTNQYDSPENLTWISKTFRVTKTDGKNSAPVEI